MIKELKVPQIGEYVRFIGRLVEIIPEKPPPPPKQDYVIEEISAEVVLMYGDEVLKTIGSINDFYGLETSVETAIKEAKDYAEAKGINDRSELEVVVIKEIRQYRARPTNNPIVWTGYSDYAEFKSIEQSNYGMPEPTREKIWSSRGK